MKLKTGFLILGLLAFAIVLIMTYLNPKYTWEQIAMYRAIALAGLIIFFWLTEAIDIYVTALFPLLFGIPLGILDSKGIALAYGHVNIYLFLGGFIIALALEKHDVHKQIAKRIIRLIGNTKTRLLLGFILSTGLLSMWISNTATALMMLPMALAVLSAIPKEERSKKFSLFLLLSIAYSASVGGMATLVGSPPNLLMATLLKPHGIEVSFGEWMKIGIPVSLVMLLALFFFFKLMLGKEGKLKLDTSELGEEPWTRTQIRVLIIFLIAVFFWSMRGLFEEWFSQMRWYFKYDDLFPAMLASVLLFLIPVEGKQRKLLVWSDTKNIPWGILILFGGGIALANILSDNGVVALVADAFSNFKLLGPFTILLIVVSIGIFGTELMSNTALVNVFIPIIAVFALESNYSILQLCVPVALAASCAFMLPVGTPPNAIIFSSGEVKIREMATYGFVLNIIAIVVIVTFGYFYFN